MTVQHRAPSKLEKSVTSELLGISSLFSVPCFDEAPYSTRAFEATLNSHAVSFHKPPLSGGGTSSFAFSS